MGIPNSVTSLLTHSPKYSKFDYSCDVKTTFEPGQIVPFCKPIEMFPGEEVDINVQALTRFMALQAPVMQRYVQDVIALYVPYRLLYSENAPIWDGEKFFNPATVDSSRPAIPRVNMSQLLDNNCSKNIGSLFDYLGYPTFTNFYQTLFSSTPYMSLTRAAYSHASLVRITNQESWSSLFPISGLNAKGFITINVSDNLSVQLMFVPTDPSNMSPVGEEVYVPNFYAWLNDKFSSLRLFEVVHHEEVDDPDDPEPEYYDLNNNHSYTDLSEVIASLPGSYTSSSLMDEYMNHIFTVLVQSAGSERKVSLLPWLAYHRAISDWFLNTNLIDPDSYMNILYQVSSGLVNDSSKSLRTIYNVGHLNTGTAYAFCVNSLKDGTCVPRMWMDDYFTTAYPSAQAGANVPIPVSGSIPDLWTANRLQQFKMKVLLAGKRFIDQVRALWGVESEDMRLQRTQVLGRWKSNLVVSDVLQNSTSTESAKLGTLAGLANSYGSDHLCHYKAKEVGLLLIVGSVRPLNAYVDQVSRLIYKSDYYDFENPMFDNVGMQSILRDEIFPTITGSNTIFGYTPRRYMEYMLNFNEIHGDFKTSLDYWHAARKFATPPALNPDFVSYTPEDGLNRVFADMEGANILSQFYFDIQITRPLSRYVNYHL